MYFILTTTFIKRFQYTVIIPFIFCFLILAGCVSRLSYGGGADDSTYNNDAYRRGYVDVVCLEGMDPDSKAPDTLFGCLKAARDKGFGTIDLPKGVYLGHVSEFIVRSLKFYEIEAHFERFYGYRIVLKFREAGVRERKEGELKDYSGMLVGAVGELAVTGAGIVAGPVIFAFKAVRAEAERESAAEQAREQGLPEPSRGGGAVAWRETMDKYEKLARQASKAAGMSDADNVMEIYLVEECYLEKPEVNQILLLSERLNETTP